MNLSRLKPLPQVLFKNCGSGFSRDELCRFLKFQVVVLNTDVNDITGLELALQNLLRQWVLNLLLDCAFQRACSIYRVKASASLSLAASDSLICMSLSASLSYR